MSIWDKAVAFVSNPFVASTAGIGMDYLGAKNAGEQSLEQRKLDERIHLENMAMQKEFAQMGIRWKVEDAKAAGLHPLYAMGGSGASYTPQSSYSIGEDPMANFYSRTGQNLQRAMGAGKTLQERRMDELAIENAGLENEIKREHLNQLRNPPVPNPVIEKPVEVNMSEVDNPWQERGSYPSVTYMRSPSGLVPVMPPMLAEALESDQANQAQWTLRYKGGPNVYPQEKPDNNKLPHWASGWHWSHKLQEWQPKSAAELDRMGRMRQEDKTKMWYKEHRVRMRMLYPQRKYKGPY